MENLVDQARAAGDALTAILSQGHDGLTKSAKASLHLQERLRLGARMLKAFQSQIARVEVAVGALVNRERTIAEVEAQTQQRAAAFNERLAKCVADFELRLDQVAAQAAERLQERLVQRNHQASDLQQRLDGFSRALETAQVQLGQVQARATARLDEQVNAASERLEQQLAARKHIMTDLHERLERAAQRIESLESQADVADQRLNATAIQQEYVTAQVEAAQQRVEQTVERCMQAQGQLTAAASAAVEQIRAAAARSEEIQALIERCGTAQRTLIDRLVEADAAATHLRTAFANMPAMEQVLARLAPWEGIIMAAQQNPHGLPEPLAGVAEDLRRRISRDMSWLSSTMNVVAERVQQLAAMAPLAGEAADHRGAAIQCEPKLGIEAAGDVVEAPLPASSYQGLGAHRSAGQA